MTQRNALMILPHRALTDTKIDILPRFTFTDPAPWSPTLLHDYLLNMPDCPTRYVLHHSDDTTIPSNDLNVFPDSNIFDFS
jgi:hypothetical protein